MSCHAVLFHKPPRICARGAHHPGAPQTENARGCIYVTLVSRPTTSTRHRQRPRGDRGPTREHHYQHKLYHYCRHVMRLTVSYRRPRCHGWWDRQNGWRSDSPSGDHRHDPRHGARDDARVKLRVVRSTSVSGLRLGQPSFLSRHVRTGPLGDDVAFGLSRDQIRSDQTTRKSTQRSTRNAS